MTSAADPGRPGSGPQRWDAQRLDTELVRRSLARSRGHARELLDAGRVRVDGAVTTKPSHRVAPDADVEVEGSGPVWVGRAAGKLLAALDAWGPRGLRVAGRRCVDVGASTGGFTQVLLEHGAAHVVALDVGRGQLAAPLSEDSRVEERSGQTVRGLTAAEIGGRADLVVADLSFISLTLVMSDLAALVDPGGDVVVLVKPQFEVGRARLGKHGVVTAAGDRLAAVMAVAASARAEGLHVHAVAGSPVRGAEGNAEYLLWLRPEASGRMGVDALADAAGTLTARGDA